MHIFLDSTQADVDGDGRSTFFWSKPLRLGLQGQRIRVAVESASFFMTQPNISQTNNSITVNGNNYSLPVGWFDASSLADELTTLIAPDNCVVSFSQTASKFSFTSNVSVSISGSLLKPMGFNDTETYLGLNIEAPAYCALSGAVSVDINTSIQTRNVSNNMQATTTLCRIPVSVSFGELLIYSSVLTYSDASDYTLPRLEVWFCDQDGQLMKFDKWNLVLYIEASGEPSFQNLNDNYNLAPDTIQPQG